MIALCDKCRNYDGETTAMLREIYAEQQLEPPKSIWCKASDQPENIRWETCRDFKEYGE